jgi:hypothetical protein
MARFDDLPYDVQLIVAKHAASEAGSEKTLAYMACTSRTLRECAKECDGMGDAYEPLVTMNMAKLLAREIRDFRDMLAATPPHELEAAAVARGYTAQHHGCLQDFTVLGKSFDKYVTPRVHLYVDPVYIDSTWNFGSSVWVSFLAWHQNSYKWVKFQVSGPGTYIPPFTCLSRVRNMLPCKPFGAKRIT